MTSGPGLSTRIRRAASGIGLRLDERDVDRLVEGVHQRRRRRVVRRIGLATATVAMAAVVVLLVAHRATPFRMPVEVARRSVPPGAETAAPAAPARPLRLADGSVVTRLDAGSALTVVEDAPTRIVLELRRGRERFDVVPQPSAQRSFRVRAGEVTVTVVGTIFTMERVADRIGVTVERGTVRVDWGRGARSLHAGDSGWFPPLSVGERGESRDSRAARSGEGRAAARAESTRGLDTVASSTGGGVGAGAGAAVAAAPPVAAAGETAEQLLSAADAARIAGKSEEGAALLARLLRAHRDDPRAPLAAFTLGRLLMMELGRPREAAAVFAEVRALQSDGPFAEDALAREAEAYARAGDRAAAQARVRDYLRLYPNGRRAAAVRALGGGPE